MQLLLNCWSDFANFFSDHKAFFFPCFWLLCEKFNPKLQKKMRFLFNTHGFFLKQFYLVLGFFNFHVYIFRPKQYRKYVKRYMIYLILVFLRFYFFWTTCLLFRFFQPWYLSLYNKFDSTHVIKRRHLRFTKKMIFKEKPTNIRKHIGCCDKWPV